MGKGSKSELPGPATVEIDIYDPEFIKGVFDRCSGRYILFSDLFSFGFIERWRRQCVESMPAPNAETPRGYDLMAGTGEIWPHLLRRFPQTGAITAVDISAGMHRHAMERLHRHRAHKIDFIEDDVFASNLANNSADFVISSFGLKTLRPHHQRQLAQLIARVLKPGGVFALVEASDPKGWLLRPLYLFHLQRLLPLVERTLLRGARDFAMIGTYCSNFGDSSEMAEMLRAEGLETEFKRYFFGCATGVAGRKPKATSE